MEHCKVEEHTVVAEEEDDPGLDPKLGNLCCSKEGMERMPCGVQTQSYHVEDLLDMPIEDVVSREYSCSAEVVAVVGYTVAGVVLVGIGGEVAVAEFADEQAVVELADEEVVIAVQSVQEEPRTENYCLE